MNPTSKSPLPVVLDPVAAAIIAQLKQTISEQDQQITRNRQALVTSELMIQKLKEALRLERIKKYGVRSEKLSDLQLELLDLEPGVSSDRDIYLTPPGPTGCGLTNLANGTGSVCMAC